MLTASPETLLSHLKLHRIIGSGAFADVYLATFYGEQSGIFLVELYRSMIVVSGVLVLRDK